jgi:tetratricopeptide (TPR) repeat protein
MQAPLNALGRPAEAKAAVRKGLQVAERHLELNPDDARALYLGAQGLMLLGERDKALEWARRAQAIDPSDSLALYNLMCVYALGGQTDDALDCLERAIQNGYGHRAWLDMDTDLDSIRDHPKFQSLRALI